MTRDNWYATENKAIHIRRLTDTDDCDCCGTTWADGAAVLKGQHGDELFRLTPIAHCTGGQDYDNATIYKSILEHLGYKITESDHAY